jgi:magnesium chelatase family protein
VAIAVAILVAARQVSSSLVAQAVMIGELALDGRVRPVRGGLAAALAASQVGAPLFIAPSQTLQEAALLPELPIAPADSLREVLGVLNGGTPKPLMRPTPADCTRIASNTQTQPAPDLSDVRGQELARLALEICAAGGHHLAMIGPPGVGKTLLANRLPTLLPDLTSHESLAVTSTYSVAGALPPNTHILKRPQLVAPHHTTSATALIGGGSAHVRVGLVSLAHRGVLFLDEAPEFRRECLDALRQPLETGEITVSRVGYHTTLPAQFQLCCAANRCPCGPPAGKQCECTPTQRRRYLTRLSGPLLDRIDVRLNLASPSKADLLASEPGESSAQVAHRVLAARDRTKLRLADTTWQTNSEVGGAYLRKQMWPGDSARCVEDAFHARRISLRRVERVIRIAWSAADCAGRQRPTDDDVGLALALRDADGQRNG